MVVIRLARQGRTKYPVYRLVAADSHRAATGKFIAILGHYNPHTKELVIKHDEMKRYLGNGAQPSNTVAKLLVKDGMELPSWVKVKTKTPKPKEVEAEPEVAEEVTADEAAADAGDEVLDTEEAAEAAEAAESEERVAEVATQEASEASGDTEDIDHTDTAADEEKAVEEAEAADDAGADAATVSADEA